MGSFKQLLQLINNQYKGDNEKHYKSGSIGWDCEM